jgi:hypothetical protein
VAWDVPIEVVNRIVMMRGEEGLTLQAIADRLNRQGIKAAQGGRWGTSSIFKILKEIKQGTFVNTPPTATVKREHRPESDKRCHAHRTLEEAPGDCPDCAAGIVWPREGKLTQFRAKAEYLALYPAHGNITTTCRALGLNRNRVAGWIAKDKNFAEAFAEAKEMAADLVERTMYDIAVNGYYRPVYQQGRLVGEIHDFMPGLMIKVAQSLRPEKWREQQKVEHSGPEGGPIEIAAVEQRILSRIADLAAREGEDRIPAFDSGRAAVVAGNRVEVLGSEESA